MSYQALARKWRPRHFADVVGQDHVVSALTSALDQNRVHHAFLFTGTRGVGKTTLARLLAKALNCQAGPDPTAEPCGECSVCSAVDEGRFIDLLEVDAASRTRVDDTREILDNVQYAPTQGRYKVYLIDEVHMLSGHSFNALLKTLEEPPPHVKFLLATTDPQKLPPTILSRCLQFNLRALQVDEISGQLEKILQAEGLEFDEQGLATLARAAAGSMRDALSLLDQGIAFGNGRVTADEVRDMLGMIERRHVEILLRALAAKDAVTVIETIADMALRALDYMAALDDLLLVLHDVSLYQVAPDAARAKEADTELVVELAGAMPEEDVQLYYQIGLLGKRDLPLAPDAASGFEMTLLRMLTFSPESDGPNNTPAVARAAPQPDNRAGRAAEAPRASASRETGSSAPDKSSAPDTPPAEEANAAVADNLADPDIWAELVGKSDLKGVSRELAMNLAPETFSGNVLTVALKPSLAHLHSKPRQKTIEKALSAFAATAVRLQVVDGAEDAPETPAQNQQRHAEEAKAKAYQTLMDDPVVKDIMERFDATVVPDSIRPGKQERK
ncbi:MAG: DNA polymerase III subunit gamma/tau [Arenicellales bacterium]|nr:DNA polymerase III subunit gamma/tau [Arenicellales bacterium]